MSKWLDRALSKIPDGVCVPNVPKSPKYLLRPPQPPYFGDYGNFGTGSPSIDLADWRAHFDERAGIREFNGSFPRAEAERLAREDTIAALGPEPSE